MKVIVGSQMEVSGPVKERDGHRPWISDTPNAVAEDLVGDYVMPEACL